MGRSRRRQHVDIVRVWARTAVQVPFAFSSSLVLCERARHLFRLQRLPDMCLRRGAACSVLVIDQRPAPPLAPALGRGLAPMWRRTGGTGGLRRWEGAEEAMLVRGKTGNASKSARMCPTASKETSAFALLSKEDSSTRADFICFLREKKKN